MRRRLLRDFLCLRAKSAQSNGRIKPCLLFIIPLVVGLLSGLLFCRRLVKLGRRHSGGRGEASSYVSGTYRLVRSSHSHRSSSQCTAGITIKVSRVNVAWLAWDEHIIEHICQKFVVDACITTLHALQPRMHYNLACIATSQLLVIQKILALNRGSKYWLRAWVSAKECELLPCFGIWRRDGLKRTNQSDEQWKRQRSTYIWELLRVIFPCLCKPLPRQPTK